ncbi:hypothetical protein BJY14_007826 [Actinomadura luteofluorescens]|uniref:Uncharacterized protein n=2 Tax=Actinomadura luteofluorescens TaxID=46163 RepID=A0A7Y9EQ13_9ACTN|nr:hypothetical protein [Actinomadura luteofluorescens]NYD51843.1 hypothetical protein [Actinomadura luteofluorescens]
MMLLSPADAPLPLTGVDNLTRRVRAAGHLTERQARRALWFLQGEQIPQRQPDGAVALRPVVHYLSFALQPAPADEHADVGKDPVDDADLPPQAPRRDHRMTTALERRLDR